MAIMRNETWSLVSLPPGRQVTSYKWVFRIKENPDGTILKHKARLVAKRFHQVAGFDFNQTFNLVVKPTTMKPSGLHLSQTKYIKDLLCRAKMQNARSINTSMTSGQKLLGYGSDLVQDVQLYRSVVGALQYATIT